MYQTIDSDEFYQKVIAEHLTILDVREADEFTGGHIPQAQHLPLSELGQRWETLDQQQHYYIICHSGRRSADACQFLSQQGFQTTNVLGGMCEWPGAISFD